MLNCSISFMLFQDKSYEQVNAISKGLSSILYFFVLLHQLYRVEENCDEFQN
jgi:hypothetical protein